MRSEQRWRVARAERFRLRVVQLKQLARLPASERWVQRGPDYQQRIAQAMRALLGKIEQDLASAPKRAFHEPARLAIAAARISLENLADYSKREH